jgi:hypothetical protein
MYHLISTTLGFATFLHLGDEKRFALSECAAEINRRTNEIAGNKQGFVFCSCDDRIFSILTDCFKLNIVESLHSLLF